MKQALPVDRVLLAVAVVLTFYMLYLIACAALIAPQLTVYVLPFFGRLSIRELGGVINWSAGFAMLVWLSWAWQFVRKQS